MVDSHCHLADPSFAEDLSDVVARARNEGVERVLCVLTYGEPGEYEQGRRLAELWHETRFSIGVHPHVAASFGDRVDEIPSRVRSPLKENQGPGQSAR
jgi:TatD DNase family protein